MASDHNWQGPHPANQQDEGLSYLVNQTGTVRGHSRRFYTKLGVHTRDELQAMLGI